MRLVCEINKVPSKQRFIAASHSCTTKALSAMITKCLKLVQKSHKIYCDRIHAYTGYNFMWIVDNSIEVHKLLGNSKKKPRNLITYDFSTLYTSIPHDKLKNEIAHLVRKAFHGMKKAYIKVTSYKAYWSNSNKPRHAFFIDCDKLILLIDWLIDNTYVTVGNKVFRQTIGIPMGTDCAPFLANLFLFSYEFKFLNEQLKRKKWNVLNKFRKCARYIDDLLLINNDKLLDSCKGDIYPPELELTSDDKNDHQVHYLDLDILIMGKGFSYWIYDKRDNFEFPIVNFPDLSGNIPTHQSYSVFTSQLVRYARGCLHFKDFRCRVEALTFKLLTQHFMLHKLQSVYMKFCMRHKQLILKYGNKPYLWRPGYNDT